MTHVDILKYALALGEGKTICDKTNKITYIPDVNADTDEWTGIDMVYYDSDDGSDITNGTSSRYHFTYEDGSDKQDEIVQNLVDFVTSYLEANDEAEYEIIQNAVK